MMFFECLYVSKEDNRGMFQASVAIYVLEKWFQHALVFSILLFDSNLHFLFKRKVIAKCTYLHSAGLALASYSLICLLHTCKILVIVNHVNKHLNNLIEATNLTRKKTVHILSVIGFYTFSVIFNSSQVTWVKLS